MVQFRGPVDRFETGFVLFGEDVTKTAQIGVFVENEGTRDGVVVEHLRHEVREDDGEDFRVFGCRERGGGSVFFDLFPAVTEETESKLVVGTVNPLRLDEDCCQCRATVLET